MKRYKGFVHSLLFCAAVIIAQYSNAQSLTSEEDSLKLYGKIIVTDSIVANRFDANNAFIKHLVKALELNNSFTYPFDSVNMMSKLYAPDNSFRIFTWQVEKDANYVRQYGAIQLQTSDGKLKLIPLFDASEFTIAPEDSIRTNKNWIGAIYYKIILNTYNGKKIYTLLGLDDNNILTTRKWIEILTFDKDGEPQFGGDYFEYKDDPTKPKSPVDRFCVEYKKDAKVRVNYDSERRLIMMDHLISEDNKPLEKMTLIPDGDYEAFRWEEGKWRQVEKVYNQRLMDGQAPLPNPTKD